MDDYNLLQIHRLKHEKPCKFCEAEIRASEREKMLARYKKWQQAVYNASRQKEFNAGYENATSACEQKCASKCSDAFCRGQADLIEKLISEYGRGQLCDGCIAAIKLASESLGTKSGCHSASDCLDNNPKPENAAFSRKSCCKKAESDLDMIPVGKRGTIREREKRMRDAMTKPEKPKTTKKRRRNGYAKRL